MEIPTTIRPILTRSTRAWTWRLILLISISVVIALASIAFKMMHRPTNAPGAYPGPGRSQTGKVNSSDRGGSIQYLKKNEHYVVLLAGIYTKLILTSHNLHVVLHKRNTMNIFKQHVILNLIRSNRYVLDHETGNIISNIGIAPRVIKPIVHYSGYLQYVLDIGFNERITVYGQVFSFLAKHLSTYDPVLVIDHGDKNKANNKPDNLRCITEKENLAGPWRNGNKNGARNKKPRLSMAVKEAIKADFIAGISQVKLAEKYNTTRQTIARIVNVT